VLNDFIQQFGPSTVGGLVAGSIYALVALGYTMVYGVLRADQLRAFRDLHDRHLRPRWFGTQA